LVFLAFVAVAASACGGASTNGGAGSALVPSGGGQANSPGRSAPDSVVRCMPTVSHACPTPGPTPTPSNGPVGAVNNVSYLNGTLLTSAVSHVVYVDGTANDGDQIAFLNNLEASSFFTHIVNQYVPNHGAFTVDQHAYQMSVPLSTGYVPIYSTPDDPTSGQIGLSTVYYYNDNNIQAAIKLIAGSQVGPTNIWHVIVPPVASNNICTQAGMNLNCWHDQSGDHQGVSDPPYSGNLYYTEQWDATGLTASTPDNTSSTLSHELFETITDPNGLLGWRIGFAGNEIGDICEGLVHTQYLPYQNLAVGSFGALYDIQPEWSNSDEHCYPEADFQSILTLGPLAKHHTHAMDPPPQPWRHG
jgi:hypothetical protein